MYWLIYSLFDFDGTTLLTAIFGFLILYLLWKWLTDSVRPRSMRMPCAYHAQFSINLSWEDEPRYTYTYPLVEDLKPEFPLTVFIGTGVKLGALLRNSQH